MHIKLFLAEFDAPKFEEQNGKLYESLKKSNLPVEMIILSDVDHFNIVENLTDENYELLKIIIRDSKL